MWRLTCLDRFIFIGFLLLLFSGSAVAEGPSVIFKETRFDFGSIKKGEKVVHDFEFANKGKATLVIEKLIPA